MDLNPENWVATLIQGIFIGSCPTEMVVRQKLKPQAVPPKLVSPGLLLTSITIWALFSSCRQDLVIKILSKAKNICDFRAGWE